ncbi:TlpA family protein disulfide reductase [Rhizosphaericola mali]|uniref:Redoxin domain-containing protein n=1 Tax=Rhizosphaericola mali TaxID=2545455 RepID=A0A5P2FZR8_9BACT|nr:thioredoxin domain-containing protein [Rhizosphaericola mali]QES89034.1 redoxin domain-containing protein [Rhizosphaericola mali]
MKKLVLALVLILSAQLGFSQTYDSIAPYKKDKNMPTFQVLLTDSTWYSNTTNNHNQPTLIIYFNPDCDHCQHMAASFEKDMDAFKNVNLLWTTYLAPLDELKNFSHSYNLDKYPNVYFGKDPNYAIPAFFRVEYTPFVALYDKNNKLVHTWTLNVSADEIKFSLKNLK